MQNVDQLLSKRTGKSGPKAEVALIALDPQTGEIKSAGGGQKLSAQPVGSHSVEAAAGFGVQAVCVCGRAGYRDIRAARPFIRRRARWTTAPRRSGSAENHTNPANFRGEHFGTMTFRQALAKSDNVAAVNVAQEVGYGKVVEMARRFGLNDGIRATPSVALGAYQVTPLEIAAAYTAFANGGVRVKPSGLFEFSEREQRNRLAARRTPSGHSIRESTG